MLILVPSPFSPAGVSGTAGFAIGTLLSTRSSRPLLWLGLLLLCGGTAGLFAHLVQRTESGEHARRYQYPALSTNAPVHLGPSPAPAGMPYGAKVTLFALAERVAVAAAVPTLNNSVPPLVATTQRSSFVFSCVLFGRICLFAAPFVGNLVRMAWPHAHVDLKTAKAPRTHGGIVAGCLRGGLPADGLRPAAHHGWPVLADPGAARRHRGPHA